jgi:hypothetical protein
MTSEKEIKDAVESSIEGSVWKYVIGGVRTPLFYSVDDLIGRVVIDSVWGSVGGSVWDSVRSSIRNSINNRLQRYAFKRRN